MSSSSKAENNLILGNFVNVNMIALCVLSCIGKAKDIATI